MRIRFGWKKSVKNPGFLHSVKHTRERERNSINFSKKLKRFSWPEIENERRRRKKVSFFANFCLSLSRLLSENHYIFMLSHTFFPFSHVFIYVYSCVCMIGIDIDSVQGNRIHFEEFGPKPHRRRYHQLDQRSGLQLGRIFNKVNTPSSTTSLN